MGENCESIWRAIRLDFDVSQRKTIKDDLDYSVAPFNFPQGSG